MSGEGSVLTWLPLLGGLALKSLIVFLVAGVTLLTLRRASASARHLVCLLTLTALLALPVLSLALPGWRLPVPLPASPAASAPVPSSSRAAMMPVSAGTGATMNVVPFAPPSARLAPLLVLPPTAVPATPHLFPWTVALSALWLGGALLAVLRPLLGLWGIARLSRDSASMSDAPTLALASECASALGLSGMPALRQADAPVPMTWGWRRPVVLLPTDAHDWPDERLRAVLLHELAHVRRRDWLSHRFADIVCALYWFYPLAWLTARRLRTESEIACDDLVLISGVAAPDYARHLLDVARALRPASSAVPQAAIAMARTARIEGRLKMILDHTRSRRALSRRALLLTLGLSAAALVPLAVLHPGVRAQAAAPGVQAAKPGVVSHQRQHRQTLHVTPATPTFVWTANAPVGIFTDRMFVQLAGVAYHNTLQWWGADGTYLPQPILNLALASRSADVRDAKQRPVHLAFRLPATAQDVTVKYVLTDSLYSGSAGTWLSKMQSTSQQTEAQLNARTNGVRILTAIFPASVSRTNVRVGIASGPWKPVATTGLYPSKQVQQGSSVQRGNTSYIFSPLAETKQGTMLTVSVGTAPLSSITFRPNRQTGQTSFHVWPPPAGLDGDDLRVVAVDGQGREVLPADIGDNSIGALDQITAHFALPPSQIKEVYVETRPFCYVEFKNVALRPVE